MNRRECRRGEEPRQLSSPGVVREKNGEWDPNQLDLASAIRSRSSSRGWRQPRALSGPAAQARGAATARPTAPHADTINGRAGMFRPLFVALRASDDTRPAAICRAARGLRSTYSYLKRSLQDASFTRPSSAECRMRGSSGLRCRLGPSHSAMRLLVVR